MLQPHQLNFNKAFLIILVAISFAFVRAQLAPQANSAGPSPATGANAGSTPVFKNRAELVLVPVVVRDKNGKPVTGLSKDFFQLEENGKKRDIASFEEVKPFEAKVASADREEGYSNLPGEGSRAHVTIVVLDLINTNQLQRTDGKEQLLRFLSQEMPTGEPVSLLCLTADGVRLVHPITSDTAAVTRALRQYKTESAVVGAPQNFVHETMTQLREIARAYSGVAGRKTLIWAAGYIPTAQTPGTPYGAGKEQVLNDIEETWKVFLSENVAVYSFALLPDSISELARPPGVLRDQTIRSFASTTGGGLCVEDNGLMDCLKTGVEDSLSYYVLTYILPSDDRNPGWRTLKVKAASRPAELRARAGFYYEPPAGSNAKIAGPRQDEINALASPLAASGVLMNVRLLAASEVGPKANGKVTQRFLITVPRNSISLDSSQNPSVDLHVGAIAINKQLRVAAEFLRSVHANPKPDRPGKFGQDDIRLEEELDIAPGTYDIRFVVRDNHTGKLGTVVFPLEVK